MVGDFLLENSFLYSRIYNYDIIKLRKERGYHMNNKGVGVTFCLISAILISAKYISAAIFMSNVTSWDSSLFKSGINYVGPFLSSASIVALIMVLLFLGYGLYTDKK